MTMADGLDLHIYSPHDMRSAGDARRADAITTQVLRHALASAANQMKRVLIRTSFSPGIYEAHDFAVALYDRQVRLLAQAPTLPAFMGTMSFCVEGAVAAVGGEAKLEPGDAILYNIPFGTGSHAPDVAVVLPVFRGDELVGYAACKAHLMDIGAKDPYCTDTTDMFQEGLLLDGVKIYRRGELAEDVMRIILSNSRMPSATKGDILADVVCCQAGADELLQIIERFGMATFLDCTERMYEHGEALVRDFIGSIPDGRYRGAGYLDDDGLSDDPIEFSVDLVVKGDHVTFDLSNVPDAAHGPVNCPFPSTASACRIALALLAGNEMPNEGHFRPLKIMSRPGSIFHPVAPQPTFMYGALVTQLLEALFQAFAVALPGQICSGSAGDLCGIMIYAHDNERGELSAAGAGMSIGMGALAHGDGATLVHIAIGNFRLASAELMEAKYSFFQYESWEIEPDSAGPGRYRGGLGWRAAYRFLQDAMCTIAVDRTKVPSWAQAGGLSGAANKAILTLPDDSVKEMRKATGFPLPKGCRLDLMSGGGGGYGPPAEREPALVHRDLQLGYISEAQAREHYAHAFD